MNATRGFRKQYNVCGNDIISLYLRVVFGYIAWIFCELFKSTFADQWRADVR